MAKKKSGSGFIIFLILLVIAGGVVGYVFLFTDYIKLPSKPTESTTKSTTEYEVFTEAQKWVPEVVWSKPKAATQQTYYGTVKGTEITGKMVNREGYIEHPEDPTTLKAMGFSEDLNLSADGPGSSSWGYIKNIGDMQEIIVLSYKNEDMHASSEGPLEAECPCTLLLTIFQSEPFKPNWQ